MMGYAPWLGVESFKLQVSSFKLQDFGLMVDFSFFMGYIPEIPSGDSPERR